MKNTANPRQALFALRDKAASQGGAAGHSMLPLTLTYFAAFVLLDRMTRAFQMFEGIAAWYPPVALSVALLLGVSPLHALTMFLAAAASDYLNWHDPLGAYGMFPNSASMALCYAAAAVWLRKKIKIDSELGSWRDLVWFVPVNGAAALLSAYVGTACIVPMAAFPAVGFSTRRSAGGSAIAWPS
jgi:hypothetical protein